MDPHAPAHLPGRATPALAVVVGSAVGVWALWRVFVATPTGRLVDEAAFEGAQYGRTRLWQVAEPVLDVISVPFIAAVLLATMLLAVLRSRVLLAVQVAVVMGGANLTTQVLKHGVLPRPDLGLGDTLRNTLPSGHTTAAASVAVALVLVVPTRLRPLAALLGVTYTVATGVSTLVGGWHRPSDVIAGVLVVLGWAGLATAIGVRATAYAQASPTRRTPLTAGVVVVLAAAGLAAGSAAVVALSATAAAADAGLESRAELLTAYGGGALGVGSACCLAFAVLLVVLSAADPRRAVGGTEAAPDGARVHSAVDSRS